MDETLKNLSQTFKKYNLGCGTHFYPGFLNIGYWSNLGEGSVYKDLNGTQGTFMLNFDLRHGIPAQDDSLDLVYHSHMLEHLSYLDGITFLKECYRTLAPGARMRVLVPDLEIWINAYTNKNRFFFEEYRKVLDPEIYVTNASIFMGMLHNHEHKWGYDFDSLKWLVEHVGFVDVKRTLYADSTLEDILIMEPQMPLRIMETLCIECHKPQATELSHAP
jgi:predicted SAM-dependent methyltransferase